MSSAQLAIDFTAPREAGRIAAEACAEKAERVASFDTVGAGRFILSQLHRHGQMSGEALTDAAKTAGFRPMEDRAFGAVFQRLVRANQIRCVGFCLRAKGHGTAGGRVWSAVL